MSQSGIDSLSLRTALGAFATGVTIVTTRAPDGSAVGLTASSFNSVSLEPPLVLWSLALNSRHLDAFRYSRWWAVHILAADQEALSARFSSRLADRFEGIGWEEGAAGVPLLGGCSARFVCHTEFEYEGGDHLIFVGKVTELARNDTPPLIFHGGRYRTVMPQGGKPRAIEPGDDGDFGRHFIGHLLAQVHNEAFAAVREEYRRQGLRTREYTVLSALGLGSGQSRAEFVARVARAGFNLPQEPIDSLISRGLVEDVAGTLHLCEPGRQLLMQLIAVAQASQLRIEALLRPDELGVLTELLNRIIAPTIKPASPAA